MKEEFNLSEEREEIFKWCRREYKNMFPEGLLELIIDRIMQQDAEFIRLIEEKVLTDWKGQNEFIDWLKSKAGEELKWEIKME